MLDRAKLTSHLNREEDRILGNHILDRIAIVLQQENTQSTNFLDPYEQEIATVMLKQLSQVNYLVDGGYQGAERKRITIFPEYLFPDHIEPPVAILRIEGNFNFHVVEHRDYLGAITALGIKREMLGDILVLNTFSQVVVAEELREFIILNLGQVHQVPVVVTEIAKDDLVLPPDNTKEIKATVASLRLDAVASAGFGDSRSKIVKYIKSEKVKVNWKLAVNPAQKVEVNDLISLRGRGRIEIIKDNGRSHRDRIKLLLKKYN